MRSYRRPLNTTYKDHVTTEEVLYKIQDVVGNHDGLLSIVEKRKLRWHVHISRPSGMNKPILQGTVKGTRRRGRQRKRREDNTKHWPGLEFSESVRAVEDIVGWRRTVETSTVVPRRSSRLTDRR